jgi:hypothetical protein
MRHWSSERPWLFPSRSTIIVTYKELDSRTVDDGMVRGIIDRGEVSETFALGDAALVLGETVVIPIALNNKLPTSGRVHGRGTILRS